MITSIISGIGYFLLWTLVLYWVHRLAHTFKIPYVTDWHWDHHKQITLNTAKGPHWGNLLLWSDSWKSTLDMWCTDVIPTIIFCWVTGQWWIGAFYYIWAAFFQEALEHNQKLKLYPFLTTGSYHLVHHKDSKKNFGLFVPIWDIVFRTNKPI